ncbi:MAG: HigA family addiction module antidote protein [Verrucomicrobiota bacterium]|nr:HigA family addiction module antidote protein [Verrucomicrobiota bacterium]
MKTNKLAPIHPGEILREDFMKPRGLSQNALARALNVPPRRINEIVLEKRGITADTAKNVIPLDASVTGIKT